MLRKSVFVVLLLTFISANAGMAFAQVSGGFDFPCSEVLVDLVAICAAHIVCTKPPDPIDSFDIGARSFATCSNQPVDNFASIDARINMPAQKIAPMPEAAEVRYFVAEATWQGGGWKQDLKDMESSVTPQKEKHSSPSRVIADPGDGSGL